jgi:hypothetical protein
MGEVKTVRVHKGGDIRADHPRDQRYDVCGIDMVRADALDDLRTERDRLERERDRMREALEFYANPDNYLKGASPMTPYVDGKLPALKGRYDGGDIARAALKSEAL